MSHRKRSLLMYVRLLRTIDCGGEMPFYFRLQPLMCKTLHVGWEALFECSLSRLGHGTWADSAESPSGLFRGFRLQAD